MRTFNLTQKSLFQFVSVVLMACLLTAFSFKAAAQANIAPSATVTGSDLRPISGGSINDLNFGTCGSQ